VCWAGDDGDEDEKESESESESGSGLANNKEERTLAVAGCFGCCWGVVVMGWLMGGCVVV